MSKAARTTQLAKGIQIIRALAGHEVDGLRLKQVADACGLLSPNAFQLLEELASLGVVQRNPKNKDLWHLGPALVQIAIAFQSQMAVAHQRLADFEHNYTRTPN